MDTNPYDAVIIGGGAAGLSAALVLGRARRRVALIDAGSPRNAPASHMHGYLSRDGMPRPSCSVPVEARPAATASRSSMTSFSASSPASPSTAEAATCSRAAASWWPRGSAMNSRTSPVFESAGDGTCSTARTATAGRSATKPSGCSAPTPRRSSTPSWCASGPRRHLFRPHTRALVGRGRGARRPRHPHRARRARPTRGRGRPPDRR